MATAPNWHVRNSNTAVDINLLNERKKDTAETQNRALSIALLVSKKFMSLAIGFGRVNLGILLLNFELDGVLKFDSR